MVFSDKLEKLLQSYIQRDVDRKLREVLRLLSLKGLKTKAQRRHQAQKDSDQANLPQG